MALISRYERHAPAAKLSRCPSTKGTTMGPGSRLRAAVLAAAKSATEEEGAPMVALGIWRRRAAKPGGEQGGSRRGEGQWARALCLDG